MSTWEKYRDMIDLPYPGESKHTRMPVRDRAAQFAPFAALTGFGAVLKETERITEKRIELDEYEKEKLNENLRLLLEKQESRPEITVTFFVPDESFICVIFRTLTLTHTYTYTYTLTHTHTQMQQHQYFTQFWEDLNYMLCQNTCILNVISNTIW